MDWKRVKSILIALLLVTDLLLGYNIYIQFGNRISTERDAIETALRLVGAGYGLSSGMILALPERMYSYIVPRDAAAELAFAQKLLGDDTTSRDAGGGIIEYTGRRGSAVIRSAGEIELEAALDDISAADAEGVKKLLTEAGLSIASEVETNALGSYSVPQTRDGFAAPRYSLTCAVSNGRLKITGRWLISTQWRSEERSISRAELVIKLGDWLAAANINAVLSIEPAYHILTAAGRGMYASPVWVVETDAGVFMINALSGVPEP